MTKYKIENKKTVSDLILIGKVEIIITFLISFIASALWFLNFEFLKAISLNNKIIISPLTAFSFVILSLAVWLIRNEDSSDNQKLATNLLCIIPAAIGLTRIAYLLFNLPNSLDELILGDLITARQHIQWDTDMNLMSPVSGFLILHASFSVWLTNYTGKDLFKIAQFINFTSVLIGLLSIYTYVYDIENLYAYFKFTPISIYSSICIVLFSTGILFLRPHRGSMATVIGGNTTQIVLLRFLSFFIPLIVGWLKIEGTQNHIFGKEFGTALYAGTTFAISMTLLGWKSFVQSKLKKTKHESEQRIIENRKLIKRILDVSPSTITIINLASKKFVFVNKSSRDTFRIDGKNLENTKYSTLVKKLVIEEDKEKAVNRFDEFKDFNQDDSNEITYRVKDKDDNINWMLSRASVFEYKDDKVENVILNSLNITKQKKLEMELRDKNREIEKNNKELEETNQRLKEINENLEDEIEKAISELKESERISKDFFEHSLEGIVHFKLKDLDGIDTSLSTEEQLALIAKHAIVYEANKAFAKVHGYDNPENIVGTPITKLLGMDEEKQEELMVQFIKNDYRVSDYTNYDKRKDGSTIKLRSNIIGVVENDKLVAAWSTDKPVEDDDEEKED